MSAAAHGIVGYEPPTVAPDSSVARFDAAPHELPLLAPGVRGWAIEQGARIAIPMMIAERPGSGDVGRFLDSLSARCVIPCVISIRLEGMLWRRGFRPTVERDEAGDLIDVWRRAGVP